MKKLIKFPKRQRIFESLEPRHMLAGNVTATQVGDRLEVFGDAAANVLLITQTAPDTFKLTGGGTRVNGSFSPQTFSGVTNLFVDMAGGNDALTLRGLTLTGESGDVGLGILLGSGHDALLLTSVNVSYKTAIDGGSGNNAIVIDKCNFNYDLGIQTYAGVDAIAISRTNILGALAIHMGDGTNALTMLNVTVTEAVGEPDMIPLPEGFEILEDALPDESCGADIEGGSGVDAIALNGVKIDCITEIETGSGVDSVAIVNSRFGNQPMIYSLQAQLITDGAASGLCIETGSGNDAVAIVNTTVYGFLQIDTSGQVECPCDNQELILKPERIVEVKDGIDAVALTKVNVFAAQQLMLPTTLDSDGPSIETVEVCCVQNGALFIYTGNQVDSVALAFVCTDGKAIIRTTDLSDSSLDGADAVAIANSKFNQQSRCNWETGLCIVTGRGNDAVSIAKVNVVGKAKIETGDGSDKVAIAFLTADRICVRLGDGNYDLLTISNSKATDAVFDGGGNTGDTLIWKRLNNAFDSESDSGFQYVL